MENANSDSTGILANLLAEQVDINRADLVGRYQQILRESLFTNRAFVRPSLLKQIAVDEAEALLRFLRRSGFSGVERGEKLQQAGLNVGAVLRLNQVSRQFLIDKLDHHQVALMLEIVDAYQQSVIEGFVQSIDKENHIELEHMRNALQRGAS